MFDSASTRDSQHNGENGFGTNRNEHFHRFLKSFFNNSKIGMCLVHALITVLIHAHNSEVRVKGKRMIRPVSASQFQDHSQT